jgi:hypothetical protein
MRQEGSTGDQNALNAAHTACQGSAPLGNNDRLGVKSEREVGGKRMQRKKVVTGAPHQQQLPMPAGATSRDPAPENVAPHAATDLAILTVHGTNDADGTGEGGRWWQKGSTFTTRLLEELARLGISNAEIVPVRWSGANSDFDRLAGSAKLAAELGKLELTGRPHAIIAHSHGGNVAMEALGLRRKCASLESVVTFGTPFFSRRLKAVPMLIVAFKLIFGSIAVPFCIYALVSAFTLGDTSPSPSTVSAFFVPGLFGLLCLYSGIRQLIHKPRLKRNLTSIVGQRGWLSIYSPRDEALVALMKASSLVPEYVTARAAIRAITNSGAVVATVIASLASIVLWVSLHNPDVIQDTYIPLVGWVVTLVSVPVFYLGFYFAFWGIARAGGGWLYAKTLSNMIHGGVINAIYGSDARFKITGVTRTPPYTPENVGCRLDASNLGGIDEKAVFVSAQNLYDDLVSEDAELSGLGDPDKLWKHLSDALYHNAYMRDDGVIAHVARHLAAGKRSSGP